MRLIPRREHLFNHEVFFGYRRVGVFFRFVRIL